MNVYTQMQEVQRELCLAGIAKGDYNEHGKYKFRGIDAVMRGLSPILARNGLMIVPTVVESECRQVQTSGGKPSNHWVVKMNYTFFASESTEPEKGYMTQFHGEAMDSSDKGLGKAITSAFKSMLFEVFCIPTEGQDDADSENIQIADQGLGAEQEKILLNLIDQTSTDIDVFRVWLGIGENEVFPARLFDKAQHALQQKAVKLNQAQGVQS